MTEESLIPDATMYGEGSFERNERAQFDTQTQASRMPISGQPMGFA